MHLRGKKKINYNIPSHCFQLCIFADINTCNNFVVHIIIIIILMSYPFISTKYIEKAVYNVDIETIYIYIVPGMY